MHLERLMGLNSSFVHTMLLLKAYYKCLDDQVIFVWSAINYGGRRNVASLLLLNY